MNSSSLEVRIEKNCPIQGSDCCEARDKNIDSKNNEIPGELLCKNIISSHMEITYEKITVAMVI